MTEATDNPAPALEVSNEPATEPEIETTETPETDTSDEDQSTATGEADNAEGTEESDEGRMLKADYTRKTQELAEIRKVLNERQSKLDTIVTQGEALVQTLAAEFQAEFQGVDWLKLAAEDPAQYVHKRAQFDERQRKLGLAVGQLQQAQGQKAQVEQESLQSRLVEEQKRLFEAIPDWKEPAKATAEMSAVREYLTKSGYDPEEVNGVTDHRAVVLARKAMLYDKLTAKLPKAAPVPSAPPPPAPAQSKAKAAPNPDKMSMDEWLKWRNSNLARKGRG